MVGWECHFWVVITGVPEIVHEACMCQGLRFEVKDNNFSKVPTITQQVFVNALKEMKIPVLTVV